MFRVYKTATLRKEKGVLMKCALILSVVLLTGVPEESALISEFKTATLRKEKVSTMKVSLNLRVSS